MMNNPDGIFDAMVKQAMEEVSNGWREASQNAVTLAAFGAICARIDKKFNRIVQPAWVVALSAAGTALWFIISEVLGL